jgi:hypothetical protein
LSTLQLGQAQLSFNDIPTAALELLYALQKQVLLGVLLGDSDAGPGAWRGVARLTYETDRVFVVSRQGGSSI